MSNAATFTASPRAATPGGRRVFRRIGAVAAGLVSIFVLSSAVDAVLHATGVYPPYPQPMSDALFVVATAYRTLISIFGCWLTARLAPDRPMKHALALGVVGLVASIVGSIVMWGLGPAWYPLTLIALTLPCAWVGGRLRLDTIN